MTDYVDGMKLSTLTCTATPCSQSQTIDPSAIAGPYNVTQVITIISTGANSFSLDGNLFGRPLAVAVAEPGSLLLLAIGLLGLCAIVGLRKIRGAR